MAACGAGNPDSPDAGYSCEYPVGHDRIWRYGAWQDHGAPSVPVFWVVPPYTEDEVAAVHFVVGRAKDNPQVEALLTAELAALGWEVVPRPRFDADTTDTAELAALSYGGHAAVVDHPEYRAAGYRVIEPEAGW